MWCHRLCINYSSRYITPRSLYTTQTCWPSSRNSLCSPIVFWGGNVPIDFVRCVSKVRTPSLSPSAHAQPWPNQTDLLCFELVDIRPMTQLFNFSRNVCDLDSIYIILSWYDQHFVITFHIHGSLNKGRSCLTVTPICKHQHCSHSELKQNMETRKELFNNKLSGKQKTHSCPSNILFPKIHQ